VVSRNILQPQKIKQPVANVAATVTVQLTNKKRRRVMNIGRLRTIIEDRSDSELVFLALYDKDEAEELIQNNLMEDFGASNDVKLTQEEWVYIYTKMIEDEGIWNEINESFRYYINNVVEDRAKGNAANVNSK
jgi:hypothetical protein